jgi:hypothetical protein
VRNTLVQTICVAWKRGWLFLARPDNEALLQHLAQMLGLVRAIAVLEAQWRLPPPPSPTPPPSTAHAAMWLCSVDRATCVRVSLPCGQNWCTFGSLVAGAVGYRPPVAPRGV